VTGYRQMRRHARQARRAGMEPMMVINSGGQFPEPLGVVIVAALGRLAFRHRSVFAPLWGGGGGGGGGPPPPPPPPSSTQPPIPPTS
jgi:hypothetical protein